MTKQQLEAIRINQEIRNFNKIYCRICGKEINVYESAYSRDKFLKNGYICEECEDN